MALLISDALAELEDIRQGHTEDAEIAVARREKSGLRAHKKLCKTQPAKSSHSLHRDLLVLHDLGHRRDFGLEPVAELRRAHG